MHVVNVEWNNAPPVRVFFLDVNCTEADLQEVERYTALVQASRLALLDVGLSRPVREFVSRVVGHVSSRVLYVYSKFRPTGDITPAEARVRLGKEVSSKKLITSFHEMTPGASCAQHVPPSLVGRYDVVVALADLTGIMSVLRLLYGDYPGAPPADYPQLLLDANRLYHNRRADEEQSLLSSSGVVIAKNYWLLSRSQKWRAGLAAPKPSHTSFARFFADIVQWLNCPEEIALCHRLIERMRAYDVQYERAQNAQVVVFHPDTPDGHLVSVADLSGMGVVNVGRLKRRMYDLAPVHAIRRTTGTVAKLHRTQWDVSTEHANVAVSLRGRLPSTFREGVVSGFIPVGAHHAQVNDDVFKSLLASFLGYPISLEEVLFHANKNRSGSTVTA